jgi:hypothetical protein
LNEKVPIKPSAPPFSQEIATIDGQNYVLHKGRLFNLQTHEYLRPHAFTKKQKRAFMRLKSGFEIAVAKNERIGFLTLSTKYDIVKRNGVIVKDAHGKSIPANPEKRTKRLKELNHAYQKLKDNMEYCLTSKIYERTCRKQHKIPYIHSVKRKKKITYPQLWEQSKFKFKYFKAKTDEGGGVLHIVFRKHRDVPMIPYKWLVAQWGRIWGSTNVSISEIAVTDCERLGLYMVGQYFARQPVLRISYSRQWIGQSVKQRFIHLCEVYGFKRAIEVWSKNCRAGSVPTGKSGFQKRFRWKKMSKSTLGVVGCQHWNCTSGGFRNRPSSFQSLLDDPIYNPLPENKEPDFLVPPITIDPYEQAWREYNASC